ncbi:MAG TPA: DNA polymerase III subunit alpha [Pirellulales bacterium]|nr:DNA polymerase III subunit alpha [Pirellulales bacterium]
MSDRPFVHLHCHSHYSLLDGASPIDGLIARAKGLGMNALALTDHGNLYGALEFYQEAKSAGINPIIGYEAYVAPGSRFNKEVSKNDEASYHLTLLAQNAQGFKNLIKLSSSAFLEGFYRKPRIDKELLAAHHEGLICLSGCVSGEFSRALLRGQTAEPDLKEAMETAAWFHKLFGDRYFIEIQNNGLEIQRMAMEGAVEVARHMGLPLVATSDAHYIGREDAEAQDVLLCINTGKFRTDTNRMRMEGDQFYLRGPEEMYSAFPGFDEAVARSQQIADSVNIELQLGQRHFPAFDVPDDKTPTDYLRELCLDGLRRRYANVPEMWAEGELAPVVMERLERELDVINRLGFPNYFLIVWDFVRFAASRDIPATARGSGVGALVSYALGLSHVCPLKYDLLFERFLDISRLEAPDIDIDFCKDRRGEVIQYVKDKYGEENVAQIGTFGTLAARAAIRDVGRALGLPIPRVDAIVAMVPETLNISLSEALEQSEDLKKTYGGDPEVRELLDLAQKIEGLARNVGTHAAAVVIADRPLNEYVPLQRVTGKEEIITQWAMGDVERAGLLKMDFLGLRNLTILSKAVALIEKSTGQRVDPYQFPLDDKETFALLCRGETKGIFQLESGGIRDLLQRMKPDHFRDIIATNALYRPGPLEGGMVDDYIQVKHGRQHAEYLHPVMKDVLEETNGVMVYQEQVMRILNRLGGIELPKAYTCIKAISKKKLETIAKFREQFVQGSVAQGLSKNEASELFGMIEKFAGYGFNKSHSTAYALIAYMTAYLKAHFPVEFMAALLSGDIQGRNFKKKDSLVEHLEDCRRMEIEVVPPDVNRSQGDFVVADGKILFGLSAIKGCGGQAADVISAERAANGPFRDLFDFCERCDPAGVNRTAIESLIKAGAFDSCGGRRAQWMAVLDKALQAGASALADRRSGQRGLFDDGNDAPAASVSSTLPDVPELPERERLAAEKEVLGFYLSSHPLAEFQSTFDTYCTHNTAAAATLPHKTEVLLGGMLSAIKFAHSKNPKPGAPSKYAMFDLEDMAGLIRSIVWPSDFANIGQYVQADAVLAVRGTIDKRPGSEEANLIVNELIPLADLQARYTKGVAVRIDEREHGEQALTRLREIVRGYPGNCELQLVLQLADGCKVVCKCDGVRVELNDEMRTRIEGLVGPENFRTFAAPPAARSASNGRANGHSRSPALARA